MSARPTHRAARPAAAAVRRVLLVTPLALALLAPAAGARPLDPNAPLLGVDGASALVGDGGSVNAVASPSGPARRVATAPRDSPLDALFAAGADLVAGSGFVGIPGAGDEATAVGSQTLYVATRETLASPVTVSHCQVSLDDGEPLPVPPVAVDGPRVALAQQCPEDDDGAAQPVDHRVDVVDLSRPSPSPLVIPTDDVPGGVALAGGQVAIRTRTRVEIADAATGAPVRTVPVDVGQAVVDGMPVALAQDGTLYTASTPFVDTDTTTAWNGVCRESGPLVRLDAASGGPTTVAPAACDAPLILTDAGLLFVQRGSPGVGELMVLPTAGGAPTVLTTFRDTGASAAAPFVLGNLGAFVAAGKAVAPTAVPFAFAASHDVLAVRAPSCTAGATLLVGGFAPAYRPPPAPCRAVVSRVRRQGSRVQVNVSCPAGCDGAWNLDAGHADPDAARPLTVPVGDRTVLRGRTGCGHGHRTLRFTVSTTNGPPPAIRKLRLAC